jgi:hypothetical protein
LDCIQLRTIILSVLLAFQNNVQSIVIPAKAGIQGHEAHRVALWIPAFAGMTL